MVPFIHFNAEETSAYMAYTKRARLLFALASSKQYLIKHFDFKCAFPHEPY